MPQSLKVAVKNDYRAKLIVCIKSSVTNFHLQDKNSNFIADARWWYIVSETFSSDCRCILPECSGVGRCQTMGGHTLKVYDRSRSDRARPKAVLGVGAGGGRPLPLGGPGVLPPGKFLGFDITVDDIWWILINQMWFCVQYLMTDTIQNRYKIIM